MTHSTTMPDPRPAWANDGFLLPPPHPAQRLNLALDPRDVHRLELNAALTTAGIAPMPGDREAIDRLSELPDAVHATLHRWLTRTIL
ncbi:hypothetical protein F7R91_10180 [Streptomyces luteolifulvus]|uniref:Uncharacterized protein n=1 Tax=Streptomyces luteolifulvus TaxID=2615112 RepID=A0A6H9V5N0_9ACTN|nr:hypothetical protein [Streptomyces luteolifulvus]KAB1148254.1 hypothetical protein F7R91_10180 [Streptomyces luteolifulvus]